MQTRDGSCVKAMRAASRSPRYQALFTLSARHRCRNCGSDVPPGLKYCTNCGQPLSARRR